MTDPAGRPPLSAEDGLRLHHAHAEPLAAELAELLTRLIDDRHTFVVVEAGVTNRFVQFIACEGEWLRAESVGNRYLDGDALTLRDELELARLGWNSPETDDGDCGNYWRMWDPPNVLDAAQLAALTLCRVHRLTAPGHAMLTAARAATYPGEVR